MRGYNHAAGINILGECLPSPINFVKLSDEFGARGLPKPRIHFTAGPNEQAMETHAKALMRSIWEEGGTDIWSIARYAHTIATCRMGDDLDHSVVDPHGPSQEIPNLWISDNSTFPSALGVNPTLTIMVLALRTADRMLGGLVRHEA
jgi:choline dehydrogenase-like flavoprotein